MVARPLVLIATAALLAACDTFGSYRGARLTTDASVYRAGAPLRFELANDSEVGLGFGTCGDGAPRPTAQIKEPTSWRTLSAGFVNGDDDTTLCAGTLQTLQPAGRVEGGFQLRSSTVDGTYRLVLRVEADANPASAWLATEPFEVRSLLQTDPAVTGSPRRVDRRAADGR